MQWLKREAKKGRKKTQRQSARRKKCACVRLLRSQQITVTTNTNINRHPLTMTKWIIEHATTTTMSTVSIDGEREREECPHENNKLYKKRLTICGRKTEMLNKVFRQFPVSLCALNAAGHLSSHRIYSARSNVDAKQQINDMNDDNFFEKYCYYRCSVCPNVSSGGAGDV